MLVIDEMGFMLCLLGAYLLGLFTRNIIKFIKSVK